MEQLLYVVILQNRKICGFNARGMKASMQQRKT